MSRTDVEWLLATHEYGRGPVDWSDEQQRSREGLDLRGAKLQKIDLSELPLACLKAGLTQNEADYLIEMLGLDPDSIIGPAAYIRRTLINDLIDEMIPSIFTHGGPSPNEIKAMQAEIEAGFNPPIILAATVNLVCATLNGAHLEGAKLNSAFLEMADLSKSHLESSDLSMAHLNGSNFQGAFFDSATNIDSAILGDKKTGIVSLNDVHWNEVNISVIEWTDLKMLGEEFKARQKKTPDGKVKGENT